MVDVDWTYGAAHLRDGHQVTVPDATEALTDPDALLFDEDPKSRSGDSARLLGYSATAGVVLVVILVHKDRAGWWGANGWRANGADQWTYREGNMPSAKTSRR
ncbi:MAG TPA: hypothetical protein VFC16_06675 [Nakamurella sp.]|jgi:hypothetical protein|nr:hypothetical protein [Nakamurella sp.]